jgi:hypothetical protein
MIKMFRIVLLTVAVVMASSDVTELQQRRLNATKLAEDIRTSEFAAIAPLSFGRNRLRSTTKSNGLPLVFAHGMGDSCFNSGMKSITKESGEYMGVYSTCIPTGDSWLTDTINGFFMDIYINIYVFAEKIKADPNLQNGFNCIGLSLQGNNLCGGYIQLYNDPVASTHLSIHGPIVGVASLPSCFPDGIGNLCVQVDSILGKAAYGPRGRWCVHRHAP